MNKNYCKNCPNNCKDICEMSTICEGVFQSGVESAVIDKITELDKNKTYFIEIDSDECKEKTYIVMKMIKDIFDSKHIDGIYVPSKFLSRIDIANQKCIKGTVDYDSTYAENCIRTQDETYNADTLSTLSAMSGIEFNCGDEILITIAKTEGDETNA